MLRRRRGLFGGLGEDARARVQIHPFPNSWVPSRRKTCRARSCEWDRGHAGPEPEGPRKPRWPLRVVGSGYLVAGQRPSSGHSTRRGLGALIWTVEHSGMGRSTGNSGHQRAGPSSGLSGGCPRGRIELRGETWLGLWVTS